MENEKQVLDLDELFGQRKTVSVKWKETTYGLIGLESLSPRSISQFQSLQKQANRLQSATMGEVSEKQSNEIVELIDKMLLMLCPDLPVTNMPFAAKSRALEFYILETQGKNALRVVQARADKRTGAMRSRS